VPAGHQSVNGVVTDASYLGVSTQYLVRTGWGTELSVFAAASGAAMRIPVGANVVAYWHPRHAFLLDRAPGAGTGGVPLDKPLEAAGTVSARSAGAQRPSPAVANERPAP